MTITRLTLGALVLLILGLAAGPQAPAQPPLSPRLTSALRKPAALAADKASFVVTARSEGVDLAAVAESNGLSYARSLTGLRAAVLEGPVADVAVTLAALRAHPDVRHASLNLRFDVAGDCCGEDLPDAGADVEGLHAAHRRVERVFGPLRKRTRGRATTLVAVLDTGFDATHPDLRSAASSGLSLVDGPWDEDRNGHGTAMASLVGARPARDGEGLEGVAPGVRLLPVRVADARGRAFLADVAAGIVQAVDRGAQVVLLSLGSRLPAPVLTQAVDYAEQRGVLIVASAGNRNTNVDLFPAADPRVLSVACVDDDDTLAFSTALAPTTDLLAPGVEVAVALPRGGRAFVTGTSAAAAQVAGAAALLREIAPDLAPDALRSVIRGSARPLPLFAGDPDLARVFRAGIFDAQRLVDALDARSTRAVLADPRVIPAKATRGAEVVCSVRVANQGVVPSAPQTVNVTVGGALVGTLEVPSLQPGVETIARLRVVAPRTGRVVFAAGEQQVSTVLNPAEVPAADLAIARLVGAPTEDGGFVLEATLEGRGGFRGGALQALLGDGTPFGSQPFEALSAGEVRTLTWEIPAARLTGQRGVFQLGAQIVDGGVDDDPRNDVAYLDVERPSDDARPVRTQYQQGGKLNLIADAPFRLEPGRSYVPLLLSVPEKGDLDPNTYVDVDRVTVYERSVAAGNGGNLIYEDVLNASATGVPGLVLLDEDGLPVRRSGAPDLRLFGHQRLDTPGHYNILRVPRAALGVAPVPQATEERFLDVTFAWTNRRRFLSFFSKTKAGTTHWVLRVRFSSHARPQLPGGGDYYDAHVHTMAEWHQEDGFNLLAPRRNLGGPIPMVKEASYALGITDAIDAVRGRVITTDHNSFYNPGDTLRDRPPFGPTALAAGGGGEFEQMRSLFGITASEEVAFTANNAFFNTGILSNIQLPTGAHMLTYRANHVAGPWHGGSGFARVMGDPFPNLELEDLVKSLAKDNRAENLHAATFAAHPLSPATPWKERNFEFAFGLSPQTRTDDMVHAEGTGFVTKGLQVWNGGSGRHKVSTDAIDWNDVNPWADADFVRGDDDWDVQLNEALGRLHGDLAKLFDYELVGEPGRRFPRKVFAVAGNDAHGDFNYATSRIATILSSKSTFSIKFRAYGQCLTYSMSDHQDAASPEERAFEAMLDGNAVITDGPLLKFGLDAEDRFDSGALAWHDARSAYEDEDGHMGGGGDFDGDGTALVRRDSPNVRLGYHYVTSPEFGERGGDIEAISIYRTSVGDPNPLGQKPSGSPYLEPRGSLAATASATDLEEALDPAEEGLISGPTLLQLAAFTAPDPAAMGRDEARCYTNPVWAVPYDVAVAVARVDVDAAGDGVIRAGDLKVTFTFDMSMTAKAYPVHIKALNTRGDSSDKQTGPIDELLPAQGTGWSAKNGAEDSRYEVVSQRDIPVNLDRYPAGSGDVTFVVYTPGRLEGPHGNALNRIAATFTQAGVGTGGGAGPAIVVSTATATPGSTPAASTGIAPRGGRSSGCSLGEGSAPAGGLPLLLLAALLALRFAAGRAAGPTLDRA